MLEIKLELEIKFTKKLLALLNLQNKDLYLKEAIKVFSRNTGIETAIIKKLMGKLSSQKLEFIGHFFQVFLLRETEVS